MSFGRRRICRDNLGVLFKRCFGFWLFLALKGLLGKIMEYLFSRLLKQFKQWLRGSRNESLGFSRFEWLKAVSFRRLPAMRRSLQGRGMVLFKKRFGSQSFLRFCGRNSFQRKTSDKSIQKFLA